MQIQPAPPCKTRLEPHLRAMLNAFRSLPHRSHLCGKAVLQAAGVVLLTSAFLLPAARAQAPQADAAEQAPLSKGEIKAQREFKMLDFNRDGKLSRAEVALIPRLAAAFDDADTDKNGFVSYEEVQAFAKKYRAERELAKAAQADAEAAAAQPPAASSAP